MKAGLADDGTVNGHVPPNVYALPTPFTSNAVVIVINDVFAGS